jgi:hypothetical protein
MVLLTKDAGLRIGPNIKRPPSGRDLKVRRSGVGGFDHRFRFGAAMENCSYSSV